MSSAVTLARLRGARSICQAAKDPSSCSSFVSSGCVVCEISRVLAVVRQQQSPLLASRILQELCSYIPPTALNPIPFQP